MVSYFNLTNAEEVINAFKRGYRIFAGGRMQVKAERKQNNKKTSAHSILGKQGYQLLSSLVLRVHP